MYDFLQQPFIVSPYVITITFLTAVGNTLFLGSFKTLQGKIITFLLTIVVIIFVNGSTNVSELTKDVVPLTVCGAFAMLVSEDSKILSLRRMFILVAPLAMFLSGWMAHTAPPKS